MDLSRNQETAACRSQPVLCSSATTAAAALSAAELALQDRLKSDRDRVARQLSLDPTLIANRYQLSQIAREPERLDNILMPWQADLLRNEPALKNDGGEPA